jgi:hypothetical protein
MRESIGLPADPQLSQGFDKARRISRALAFLLHVGFWVTLAWLIATAVLVVVPQAGSLVQGATAIPAGNLSPIRRSIAMFAILLGTAPSLEILYHARRLFAHFAKGEVFASAAIAHLRFAGLWLIVSAFAAAAAQVLFNILVATKPAFASSLEFRPLLLVFGVATYVAAYVMAEARRIAEDNASIV